MDFAELLNMYQSRVNNTLTSLLGSLHMYCTPLVKAMQYSALSGGKRLRPFLVYAIGDMLQVNPVSLDILAAAVECIHTYSLIHDDLPSMDNDILRRNKPTCHIKFGQDVAILAGNALQALAFNILATKSIPGITNEYRIKIISELAQASGVQGICSGQLWDLLAKKNNTDITKLKNIYLHKTGALIRASLRIGVLASGKNNYKILPTIDNYANAIGLAFQLQDDILDVVDKTTILEKRQGKNKKLDKITYPALIGLKNTQRNLLNLYQEALDALSILESKSFNTSSLKEVASFIIKRNI